MRVVNVHGINDVRMDPIDPPTPGADDVVVRIKACGVCGTDLTAPSRNTCWCAMPTVEFDGGVPA